jgi:hypothetical protein
MFEGQSEESTEIQGAHSHPLFALRPSPWNLQEIPALPDLFPQPGSFG